MVLIAGDHVRLHAKVGTTALMMKLPLEQAARLQPGAAVTLVVAPQHCRALDRPT